MPSKLLGNYEQSLIGENTGICLQKLFGEECPIYCKTMRYTRQVTEPVALQCSDECKAIIMPEIIYDFLCLYALTKVGVINIVEERITLQTMSVSVHHVQEVINIIESQLKPHVI